MKLRNQSIKAGWLIAATATISVAAWAADIEYPGWIKVENFDAITGPGNVSTLQAHPKFTNNQPDSVTFINSLHWARPGGLNDYGSRVTGYIIPTDTADYVFFIAADDSSSFYLSTDSAPANLKLVCADQGWQDMRRWTGPGTTSSGTTNDVVFRRGYNPGPAVLDSNGYQWVGPFQNRSDEFLNSPLTNLLTSAAQKWPTTNVNGNAVIHLVAGTKYYFEMLFKEGGGGDYTSVAWKKAGDPDPANGDLAEVPAANLSIMWATNLTFSTQPASKTVPQGQFVTFSAVVLGVPGDADTTPYPIPPSFSYQWYSNNIAIPGPEGTGTNYNIVSATLAMNGSKYKLEVTSAGTSPAGVLTATSAEATLNVIVDNQAPKISTIVSSETFAAAKITFSEAVRNEAVDITKYVFSGGLTVTDANFDIVVDAATELDPKNPVNPLNRAAVILYTSTQTEGASYNLTLNGVKDMIGNDLTPNTITMYANVFRPGILTYKRWVGPQGGTAINNVAALRANQIQFENPDVAGTLVNAETGGLDGSGSGNYVSRASGFFIPAVTTNYVFLMCADNNGFTYLSTDSSPANRKLIAADVGWQNNRTWVGAGGDEAKRRGDGVGGGPFENRSDEFLASARATSGGGLPGGTPLPADGLDPDPWPTTNANGNAVITLTAGTRYYFEVWHEEFENGRAEATFKFAGGAEPVNGSVSTISGNLIGGLVDPSTVPPLLAINRTAGVTTVTYSGTLLSSSTVNGTYLPVPGATGGTYAVPTPTVGNQYYRAQFP